MSEPSKQPIGDPVPVEPASNPGPGGMEGEVCRIEPLDQVRHGDALWDAVKDDDSIWTYLPYGPFRARRDFDTWLDERAASSDPLPYAVIDRATGEAAGIVALMEIRPSIRVIEIGHIVYGTSLQRSRAATEAQYLVARQVFESLGYRRYEWKCNALNLPSRRAAERLGFTFEGIFRQHMIVKGRNRDTAWYSMLDSEWPARKTAFERWLAPANFDAEGRQRARLDSLRPA